MAVKRALAFCVVIIVCALGSPAVAFGQLGEPGPRLREVLVAEAGIVLDFDGERALVLSSAKTKASLVARAGGSTTIYDQAGVIDSGQLHPGGAVLIGNQAWLWNGSLSELPARRAKVAGGWFAYIDGLYDMSGSIPVTVFENLVLRDLTSGLDVWSTPFTQANPRQIFDYALAANGDLLWIQIQSPPGEKRWRHHEQIVELSALGATFVDTGLATDGINATAQYFSPGVTKTALYPETGSVETLCESPITTRCPPAHLNGGWTAYTAITSGGPEIMMQAWRRSPSGEREPVSAPNIDVRAEAVSARGEVVFAIGTQRSLHLDAVDLDISSYVGTPLWRGDFLLLGRHVFEIVVDDGLPADAGIHPDEDASTPLDATVPTEPSDSGSPSSDAMVDTMDAAQAMDAAQPLDASPDPTPDAAQPTDANATPMDAATPDTGQPHGDADALDAGTTAPADGSRHDAGSPPPHRNCSIAVGPAQTARWPAILFLSLLACRRKRRRRSAFVRALGQSA
jgi:hypothetical protein